MNVKKNLKELLIYLVVGGIATVSEWAFFWLCQTALSLHYAASTVIAYLLSTLVNWGAGRLLVFKTAAGPLWQELLKIYLAAAAGLALNLGIMFVCVDLLHMNEMLSKILATGIVFLFNFLIRKLCIYKKKE